MELKAKFIDKWHFLARKKVYVACSGGVDSMVLIHLLMHAGAYVHVLHLNYQLRGEDSMADEQFVHLYCEKWNLPYSIKRVDTNSYLKEHGGNLQEVARTIRYAWFSEFVETNGFLALGHHQDDQVETFLLALARKSGILGLSCMLERQGNKLRPLLSFTKQEIYDYAKEKQLTWREDTSNQKLDYARNRIRNIFLPELEKDLPSFRASVLQLVQSFQETRKALEESIEEILHCIKKQGSCGLDTYFSLHQEQKICLLHELDTPLYVLESLEKIKQAEEGKKVKSLQGDIVKSKGDLVFTWFLPLEKQPELRIELVSSLPAVFTTDEVYLDHSLVKGDAIIRPWKEGDRIASIGMKGTQKISQILKDANVPNHMRSSIYVVTDDEEILWCIGYKVGRTKIANSTSASILKLSVKNKSL
jgi:tRNA(Ile)-lysidine synthase